MENIELWELVTETDWFSDADFSVNIEFFDRHETIGPRYIAKKVLSSIQKYGSKNITKSYLSLAKLFIYSTETNTKV